MLCRNRDLKFSTREEVSPNWSLEKLSAEELLTRIWNKFFHLLGSAMFITLQDAIIQTVTLGRVLSTRRAERDSLNDRIFSPIFFSKTVDCIKISIQQKICVSMSSTSLYFLSRDLMKKNFQSYFDRLDNSYTGFTRWTGYSIRLFNYNTK